MTEEMESLHKNQMWELVKLPMGQKICWLQMGLQEEGGNSWNERCKKSLNRLKQSPRQWYKRFDTFMAERGYTRNAYDSCVYYKRLADGSHMYLLLYVDDILIATKLMSDVNGLKEQLKREFEMKDLGAAKRILGMEIQRDRLAGILYLFQKKAKYIAATEAVKEAIWMKGLVDDLGLNLHN
ncbi:hypothetical protein RJ639_022654 [Escallonia herrerae]|uniref:Reverse transcriptase Ty1/copia-type domain-containing protein n=1 Tax=Escallonia herrerae TaxID=1293975 RepID=A0AA89AD14_9ASTE|nr:hypothetical protein RJ639_022654 [Escallonia herrerae]